MLLLDVNICLHGLYSDSSDEARRVADWLERAFDGPEPVALTPVVLVSMVRIGTNRRLYAQANEPGRPIEFANALIGAPRAVVVEPGRRHWALFTDLVLEHGLVGNDVQDAYLAAIALEQGATFVTRDRGFRRFSRLRILDPLDASTAG